MSRPALEVADIFRDFGAAWRTANAGYVSLGQLKVMNAIENCRTAALGGHVMRCIVGAAVASSSKLHLVHQPQLLLPVGRVIHRREAHCSRWPCHALYRGCSCSQQLQ